MNKLYKYMTLIMFLLLANSRVGMAEPPPAIVYLVNEPLTMLEWGLYRIEVEVLSQINEGKTADFADLKPLPRCSARYDSDRNQIEIYATAFFHKFDSVKAARKWCLQVVDGIRNRFGVNPETGKLSQDLEKGLGSTLLGAYFHHTVPTQRYRKYENLNKEMDSLAKIRVTANYTPATMYEWLEATAPLLGTEVSVSESSIGKIIMEQKKREMEGMQ